jgi:SAM-dependent methyltransferase
MNFVIKSKNLPKDNLLIKDIDSAAFNLYHKLNNIDINSLEISEYVKNYLSQLLSNLKGTIQKYSFLMSLCLAKNRKTLDEFVFVDYGGGSGMFSLLAKELGIKTVIYCDIFDTSCRDAEVIAKAIGNKADEYICGEIRDVVDYFKQNSIQCDALGSYNVIEHIYDIDDFLNQLGFLSEHNYTVVLGTGANPYNPVLKRIITRHHHKREYTKRNKEYGHKEGDALDAYVNIRKRMIENYVNDGLNSEEVDLFVALTKGLNEYDIQRCVKNYLDNKIIPDTPDPKFPSNTCDPYTGNWAERLMNPYGLIEILNTNGFKTKVIAGVHGSHYRLIIKIVGLIANKIMNLFPRQALYLAPHYILYGFKA